MTTQEIEALELRAKTAEDALEAVELRAKTAEDGLAQAKIDKKELAKVTKKNLETLKRSKTVSEVKDSNERSLPGCIGKHKETFAVNPKGCRTCFAHVQCKKSA